jgi:hypothetical protein
VRGVPAAGAPLTFPGLCGFTLLRPPGKHRAHERSLVTEHAPALISYSIGRDKVRIRPEQGTVLLVGGEAGEAEKRECLVAGALAWQEVAVVSAAVQVNQFHPAPGEALEGVDLGRVDHVFNNAGDHRLQASRKRARPWGFYTGQAGTAVMPEAEIRKPLPFAVQVTPVIADTQRNGPTPVAVP